QSDWTWVAGAFVLSLLMAHLSYHWVEVPTRQYLSQASLWREIVAIAAFGVLIGLAAVTVKLKSFEGRVPEAVEIAAGEAKNLNHHVDECHQCVDTSCNYGHGNLGAIVIGDSHAASVVTSVNQANNSQSRIMLWSFNGCPTAKNAKFSPITGKPSLACFNFNEWIFDQVRSSYNNVPLIIVNRLGFAVFGPNEVFEPTRHNHPTIYFSEIHEFVNASFINEFKKNYLDGMCILSKKNPVYLVRPIPEMGIDVPKTLSRNIMFGRGNEDIKITLAEYHERQKLIYQIQDEAAEKCGVKILDPLPYLCDDQYCYGSKNGRPLYYDDDHLSEYGNKFLVPMFEQVFKDHKIGVR
ncbi:MAG: acyltransferase, partial [Campylobacterales bacterium]|nr:acyltransferase [Campylobacterales bacterium]